MKETIDVSIAGIAFRMDTEAYALLKEYLVRIEQGYKDNPDGGEIQADIEARICELILNEQDTEQPVPANRIRRIIDQMGMPDDLSENLDPVVESSEKLPRRLYRNPEGAKLGGVCSGLATYFDVEPVIVRLLFLAPLLLTPIFGVMNAGWPAGFSGTLFGVSVMLYLLLWFAIPKAKTPRQKLEMRGEKITASSIRQSFTSDFKDSAPYSPKSERSASIWADIVYIFGRIILFFIKFVVGFIAFGLSIAALAVLFSIFAVLFGAPTGIIIDGRSWTELLPGGEASVILSIIFIALFLGSVAIMLWRLIFNNPVPKKTLTVMGGIAALILIFLLVMGARQWEQWRDADWRFRGSNRIELGAPSGGGAKHTGRDSVWVEEIKVGDSIVYDTVRMEYIERK